MNYLICILTVELVFAACASQAKIVSFGSKLTEYIEQHPDKSWLIKFYAPWCYHCQQLEPVYYNVAEHIYHRHDNLIVGRVDCTKYGPTCDKYGVKSYPKIAYLNKNTQVAYSGDRSAKSIIEFAERLNGPDIHSVVNCHDLKELANHKGLIALFTYSKESNSDTLYNAYKSVAASQKSRFWFYHIQDCNNCKDFNLSKNNLYLIKRDLHKPIQFKNDQLAAEELEKSIVSWIDENSNPIYGPIGGGNLARYLSNSKPLVLAVLDKYQPAKKFSKSSEEFHGLFGEFVKKFVRQDKQDAGPLFGWTSDLDLVKGIIIGQVAVPNVLILQPNYTFHLLVGSEEELNNKIGKTLVPKKLSENNLRIVLGKLEQLTYEGGNSYLHSLMRQIYRQYNVYTDMYRANPLLACILVGLPSVILMFVIYTTCCYDGSQADEDKVEVASSLDEDDELTDGQDFEEEEVADSERQRLLRDNSHIKQE